MILWIDFQYYKETFEMYFALPMALGELTFSFWLIKNGGKDKRLATMS